MSDEEHKRTLMVNEQIAKRGIENQRVLQAMREVPRHLFVPEGERDNAYQDSPLPIGEGQTISQPYMVAYMSNLLGELPSGAKVLELGTGSGYQTAILVHMGFKVHTVERLSGLADSAELRLRRLGFTPTSVRVADGHIGLPEEAPFDGIIVTACAKQPVHAWVEQLVEGGILVAPVNKRVTSQILIVGRKRGKKLVTQDSELVRFVPLVDDRPRRMKSALGRLWRRNR